MMLMRALVCAAMLPVLVVAERFGLGGGCGINFDNDVHPIAHTEQGLQKLKEFVDNGGGKLYLWQSFNKEKEQGITPTKLTFSPAIDTFTLTLNKTGSISTITGKATYQYQPKQAILLKLPATDLSLDGIFSFNNQGEADLYPMMISKTDLILRGCVNIFLGRVEALYVLSNQDYSGLDTACAQQTIKNKYDNWDVILA